MSGAREVAATAVDNIESLIAEMLEGNYTDNEVSLGRLLNGNSEIQVQLKITSKREDFLDSDEEDLII